MTNEPPRDISEILADPHVVVEALREAVWDAVQLHKKMGVPMAISRDGAVVWVTPEEMERSIKEHEALDRPQDATPPEPSL